MNTQELQAGDDGQGNYGDQVDAYVRHRITEEHNEERGALFKIEEWNVTNNLQNNISRSNNSLEAWHRVWNEKCPNNLRLSVAVRKMMEEDNHFEQQVAEYEAAPGGGIRGHGLKINQVYVRQDEDLGIIMIKLRICS
jgi:hypothetical protein